MAEFKQILCAIDFSTFSRRALDHALSVARCYGSSVTALHVTVPAAAAASGSYYFPPEMLVPLTLPTVDPAVLTARLEELADAEQVPGVSVATLVTEAPHVHREILLQAERLGAELIVMGTHGRSGFERLFLGSTAEKVLRLASCPVLTVPPGAPDAMPRGPVPFERILCAIDFSPDSVASLTYALSLATRNRAALTLAHVIDTRPLYYDFSPPAVVDLHAWMGQAERRLRDLVPQDVRATWAVTEVVREGSVHAEIVSVAAQTRADLIVLGVRGRGVVDLLLFGSTTHHVIREAGCAVLTIRR